MSRRSPAVLVLPATLWLVVSWGWPLLLVLSMSFRTMDQVTFELSGFTLGHFRQVLTDPFYLDSLLRSVRIAAIVTLLSGLLGYPVALHIAQTTSQRARTAYTMILLIPIMISLVVTAFAWILILGPSGFINRTLSFLGLTSEPVQFLNSEAGVIAVLVYSFGPYMIINICTAIDKIDPAVIRAAQLHGAGPWRVFRSIILPLSFPGILSGGLIVFSLSAAAFVTPYVIGGNRVKVIPLQIYNAAVTTFDWPMAATLSILLLVISLALTALVGRYTERRFAAWLRGA
ncbi:ABC transporter permease [Ferrovibrio sp. MS7]|uniref:ABC transporter permease n=1 Tax=Ferrovibrio plantarum TaxID=3119164 RepID=UPI00313761F0